MPRGRRPRPLNRGVDVAEHVPCGVPVLRVGGSHLAGWEGRGSRAVDVAARGLGVGGVDRSPGRGVRRLRPGRGRGRCRARRPVDGRRRRSVRPPGGSDRPPRGGVRRRLRLVTGRRGRGSAGGRGWRTVPADWGPGSPGGRCGTVPGGTLRGRRALDRLVLGSGRPPPAGRHARIGLRGGPRLPRRSRRSLGGPGCSIGRCRVAPPRVGRGRRLDLVLPGVATGRRRWPVALGVILGRRTRPLRIALWVARRALPGRRLCGGAGRPLADGRRCRLGPYLLRGGVGRRLGLRSTVAGTVAVLRGPSRVCRWRQRRTRMRGTARGLGHWARPVLPLLPAGLHGTRVPVTGPSRRGRTTFNQRFRVRPALRPRVSRGPRSWRPGRRRSLPAPHLWV
jgi:hypothetical protein